MFPYQIREEVLWRDWSESLVNIIGAKMIYLVKEFSKPDVVGLIRKVFLASFCP